MRTVPSQTPGHAFRVGRRGYLRPWLIASLVGVFAFVATGVATAYVQLQSNISTHDVQELLGTDRPTSGSSQSPDPTDSLSGRAVNILVMGSDSRLDQESVGGDVEGMRSDTTLLVHISEDRSHVEIVSVPRDLIVEIPSCTVATGATTPHYPEGTNEHNGMRFNAAFSVGGQGDNVQYAAACTIKTFENMTGIYVDDYAVIDFDGFRDMVNAIGGVPFCVENAINDPKADLQLEPGCQTLDGDQALGFARVRYTEGDGSDISRIGRQQELMMAMVEKALSSQVMSSPTSLLSFLDSATDSLTTSPRLGNLNSLVGLGWSLTGISSDDVHFTSMDFDWSGNVVLQNAATDALWERIVADEPPAPEEPEDADIGTTTTDGTETG